MIFHAMNHSASPGDQLRQGGRRQTLPATGDGIAGRIVEAEFQSDRMNAKPDNDIFGERIDLEPDLGPEQWRLA